MSRKMQLVAAVATMLIGLGTAAVSGTATGASEGPSPQVVVGHPGVGGAGAFIPPAHVNGPYGAGGPLAGIGGAGAFIPRVLPTVR